MSPRQPRSNPSRRSLLAAFGGAGSIGLAGCATVPSGLDADGTTGSTSGDGTTSGGGALSTAGALGELEPGARFDFWPGTWDWGESASTTVYALLGGTLFVEASTGESGPPAMAMTFYDRAGGTWQRREVDATGRVARLAGGLGDDEDVMVLTGAESTGDGARVDVRASYAIGDDGAVAYRRETGGDGAWEVVAEHAFEATALAAERPAPTADQIAGSHEAVASRPLARQFDFWVGTWDVYDQAGSLIGESVVESRLDGVLLVENWQGRSGSAGHSFTHYDHVAGAWTQTWVAADASWLELAGEYDDGAMRLDGTQYATDGSSQDYRGAWTPNPDGSVTQDLYIAGEESAWDLGFRGDYRPTK